MTWRRSMGTYLLVTGVTVLIWFWAAGETRDQSNVYATVRFNVPSATGEQWVLEPREVTAELSIEGATLAIQRTKASLEQHIRIEISPQKGTQQINLVDALGTHPEILETFVTIRTAKPATVEVQADMIVTAPAEIRVVRPAGVRTEGEPTVEPERATVRLPSTLLDRLGEDLTVDAIVEETRLNALPPGIPQAIDVPLRLVGVSNNPHVTIEPSTAKVTLTVRSRQREITLDRVRVHLAGPHEDYDDYRVALEESFLRHVTVAVEEDLARLIESGEVTVIAMVHLSHREKEMQIEQKRVNYFLALVPDESGASQGEIIAASTSDGTERPIVNLDITRRNEQEP